MEMQQQQQDNNRSSSKSNISSSSSSSSPSTITASDRLLHRPILMQKSYSSGGGPDYSFADARVSKSHGGTYTPPSPCLEHHPDDLIKDDILTICLDKFWSKFAERLDGELEKRIQSVMEQQQQQQQQQKQRETPVIAPSSPEQQRRMPVEAAAQHNVMVRLHELEIAASRLDYRLAMLEKMIPKLPPAVSEDLRKENFELRAKLADREQKARQLEQEHIEFFKRQTENMIQMDQMRQKIAALEAELQKQQKHNVTRSQQQQQQPPQQQYHHYQQQQQRQAWRKKSIPPPAANRLPTPRSSPSQSHRDEEEGDLSVREIDGYLVFNTHIDGELIHCRVKIPNTTASTTTPITTTSTTNMHQQQQQPTRGAMVPLLNNMKKKGLNPYAPEWKHSGK